MCITEGLVMGVRIKFFSMYLTLDRIVLLLLSILAIFMLFGFVANLVRKGIRNREAKSFIITGLQLLFMVVAIILMLKYVFR